MRTAGYAMTFAAVLAATPASAQPLDELAIRVGGFLSRFDTTIRADDLDGSRGSEIDFDRELGLDDQALIEFVGVEWRPAERHEFGVNYFNESLAGNRRLQRELRFRDEVFPLDTTVSSTLRMEAFEFHYSWWPLVRDHWAVGFRFGLIDYRLSTRIEMLLGEQGEAPDVRIRARMSEHFPAPTFGVDVRYAPDEQWRMYANAGWFEAKLKNISPVVATARVGVEYFPWNQVGLWADFGMNHLDAELHGSRYGGAFNVYEGGLRLGITWRR